MQIGGIAVNELQVFTLEGHKNTESEKLEHSEDFSKCVYGNGHEMLYKDIVNHFSGTKPYPVSKEDTFKTLSLLHAFYVSSEKGVYVKPDEANESARLGEGNEQLANLYRTVGGAIK